MVTLYGIKNCGTIKKARRWLEANSIDYRFHDYRVDGSGNELLDGFISELGWEALFNTRGIAWRKPDEITRNKITNATSMATLITEMPVIIKRPLFCAPDKPMLLGFSESSYQQSFYEVQPMSCPVIELTQQLIRCPSPSPDDARYQALLTERLQAIGFTVECMDFADTQNFWAWRGQSETLAFAGHIDVVSLGDADCWINSLSESIIRDGTLFGRGAMDMKGSLVAMAAATKCFVT